MMKETISSKALVTPEKKTNKCHLLTTDESIQIDTPVHFSQSQSFH